MRESPSVWLAAPLWRAVQAAFVLGLALTCGSFVEEAAQARQEARRLELAPQAVTPLSATAIIPAAQAMPPSLSMLSLACTPALSLAPKEGAQIVLTLDAPCVADQRVEIAHAGMRFAVLMPVGRPLRLVFPALEASGAVAVTLEDGRQLAAAQPVQDLKDYRRFAVTWSGPRGLSLLGQEGGSVVSLEDPRLASGPDAGMVAEFGDAGLSRPALAQVYTYPADGAAKVVLQAVSVPGLCGQKLIAQTLSSRFGRAEATGLRIDLPECAAGQVVLHLKNLDQDVKVASR